MSSKTVFIIDESYQHIFEVFEDTIDSYREDTDQRELFDAKTLKLKLFLPYYYRNIFVSHYCREWRLLEAQYPGVQLSFPKPEIAANWIVYQGPANCAFTMYDRMLSRIANMSRSRL